MKFFCLADTDSGLGFRLAGVDTMDVSTANAAREALAVARSTPDVGVIIITRKAADFIRPEMENLLYKQELPLVLEVPSMGDAAGGKSAADFLKEAIGFSI